MAKKKRPLGKSKQQTAKESIDFEQALADVESIVGKLESGELGLTDSLEQYEVGIKRLKQCHALLQQAERRVMLLSGIDADGNAVTDPFDAESRDDAVSTPKSRRKQSGTSPGGAVDSQGSVDDLPGLF